MVSIRAFCYLLIFFILQLHTKVSKANFNSQGLGVSTSTRIAKIKVTEDLTNRKMLKHVNVNVEANEKNSLEIESKEKVKKSKNKKRLTKTVSLTADYSDPGHHPPRHN